MNRKNFLLAGFSATLLGISACSKSDDKVAAAPSAGSASAPAKPAPRTISLEIVANEAKGFTVGPMMSAIVAYVFFDPQCPHCSHLWMASLPLQKKARFVWIPVGLINTTSSAQGATLLSAPDPAKAMSEHEVSMMANQGGIGTSSGVTDEAKQAVASNTALFNSLGLEGVPFTIVKNARTGQPATRGGSMDTATLAALIGVDAT
ncbi:MAG: DsbC family protein [Burkholderiaceae bacterium]